MPDSTAQIFHYYQVEPLVRPRNVGWWRNHTRRDGSATCAQTLSSDLNFWDNQLASMRTDFNNHLCWCITLVEWRLSFNSYVSCRGDLLFRTMNVEPDDRNERNVGNLLCVYQISKMYGLRFCLLPASKRPWISNLCFLFLCFFSSVVVVFCELGRGGQALVWFGLVMDRFPFQQTTNKDSSKIYVLTLG